MPENEHHDLDTKLFAASALIMTLDGDAESAERWLRMIPRTKRGEVNIALENLSMMLSRLGNNG